MAKQARRRRASPALDRHYLYTAAVQSVDTDIAFFRRVWRQSHARPFRLLREDFCGTAVLARSWVRRKADHRAWGIDLDPATLHWGEQHYAAAMGRSRKRLRLLCRDVLHVHRPQVEVIAALNFSYCVFPTRDELGRYFRQVRRSLLPGGMFFLDTWGGTDSMRADEERRTIAAETAFDGTKIPPFTYVWQQERFNPIDHRVRCHIHFRQRGRPRQRRAFSYDWRFWTLPELRELLAEAGFRSSAVYGEGWERGTDEGDGIFRRKSYFDNDGAWVALIVAFTR